MFCMHLFLNSAARKECWRSHFGMGESLLENNKRCKRGNGHGRGYGGRSAEARSDAGSSVAPRHIQADQINQDARALQESQTAFMNAQKNEPQRLKPALPANEFRNIVLQTFVQAAVHEDGLAGNVGGAVGGEPDDGVGEFAGIAQALERGVGGPAFEDFLLGFARPRRA
jgi:hypothetical protein